MDDIFYVLGLILSVAVVWILTEWVKGISGVLRAISLFVTGIANRILRPLTWARNRVATLWHKIRSKRASERPQRLPQLGGLSMVIRMAIFLLFSIVTVIYIALRTAGEGHPIEQSLVMDLTPFVFLKLLVAEESDPTSAFDLVLFSLMATAFMKSTKGLPSLLRVVYDWIFNCFAVCFLFWLPDEVYSLPFVPIEMAINETDSLGVFGLILQGLAWIILICFTVIMAALTLRETFAAVAYSFPTFAALVGVCTVLPSLSLPKWLGTVLTVLMFLLLSYLQCRSRIEAEEEALAETD